MSFQLSTRGRARRQALRVMSAAAIAPWMAAGAGTARGQATGATYTLRAATTKRALVGAGYPDTAVWAYNGIVPGPVLRVRQGERLAVTAVNDLAEETSIHWHGLRIPNAMDGVPHVTQPPIAARGGRFEYAFVCPDAGTFWYHPHARGHVQVEMGLHGALIVEEREPIPVDRDVLWVLDDWRLARDGGVVRDFGSMFDSSHAGRIGNTVTINGTVPETLRSRGRRADPAAAPQRGECAHLRAVLRGSCAVRDRARRHAVRTARARRAAGSCSAPACGPT